MHHLPLCKLNTSHLASRLYDQLSGDRLCLILNGVFNDDLTHRITELTEQNVSQIDEITHLRKKMSFLVVECFQNIVRHGESADEGKRGTFWTRYDGVSSRVSAMNLVPTHRIDQLRECLQHINSLSKEELRSFGRQVLDSPMSGLGGAGLGLIEMAKRSGEPLAYDFDVESELSKFFLSISLSGDQTAKNTIDLKSKQLIDEIYPSDVLMIYKGDFNPDTIDPISKIVRQSGPSGTRGHRLLGVLIEMTYNMHLHGVYNANYGGILLLTRENDRLRVTTANHCVPGSEQNLVALIEKLNRSDRSERISMLESVLTDQNDPTHCTGLIKVANMSAEGITYSITPHPRTEFLTLSVLV